MPSGPPKSSRLLSATILALTSLLGLWAFLYPFFIPPDPAREVNAHAGDAPLIFLLVMGLSLTAIIADLETRRMDSKTVALLGVMVASNALLRPLGFAPFLLLPILCGYVFGGLFGFLMGALSVLVSAIFTNGVGPWLPFQMIAVGWVGLLSSALPESAMSRWLRGKAEKWLLAGWGGALGLLFGAVMNLWFWPFIALGTSLPDEQAWQPGTGLIEAVERYAAFYLATSLAWDTWNAVSNVLLLIFLGPPVLRLLRRFRQRFFFTSPAATSP